MYKKKKKMVRIRYFRLCRRRKLIPNVPTGMIVITI